MKEDIERTVVEGLSDRESSIGFSMALTVERAAVLRFFGSDQEALDRFIALTKEVSGEMCDGGVVDALQFEDADRLQLEPEQIDRVKIFINEVISHEYTGKVLRPAQVVVGRSAPAEASADESDESTEDGRKEI